MGKIRKDDTGFGRGKDNPYEILMKAADRVVKEQYKNVSDGMIGTRNSKRRNKRIKWTVAIVVIILFFFLLMLTSK